MAEFAVKIHRIRLEPHPNADAIELAAIGGYRSVVKLGQFQEGDLLAYIPEGAIIPSGLLQEMGLENYLAGPRAEPGQGHQTPGNRLPGTGVARA